MKLAEALILRSDLLKKLQSLKDRIQRFAVVQEGDKPHEDPKEILKQANGAAEELRDLVFKIETGNHTGKVADGRTIARALADRRPPDPTRPARPDAPDPTRRDPTRPANCCDLGRGSGAPGGAGPAGGA